MVVHFKIGLLALVLALSCTPAWAQVPDDGEGENEATLVEKDQPKRISGGMGYFMPGFGLQDLGALRAYTGAQGLQDHRFSIGGGGQLMVRSLILGGEGSSFLDRKETVGNLDLQFHSGWGKGTVGYVVYGRRGLLIYPKVGFGKANQSLTIVNTTAAPNVDSVFAGNYTGTTIKKSSLFMSFGAGFDWMPGFDETAGSGLVIGFDVGYHLGLTENGWTAFEHRIAGGPSVTPSGIYANLHIGFGGWNRQ